jgi:hypothetical protein
MIIENQPKSPHHDVAKRVDSGVLVESRSLALRIHDGSLRDGLDEAVAPAFERADLEGHLVGLTIEVAKNRVGASCWPCTRCDERVELREVTLGYGRTEVVEGSRTRQLVREALEIVAGNDLAVVVREIKKLIKYFKIILKKIVTFEKRLKIEEENKFSPISPSESLTCWCM